MLPALPRSLRSALASRAMGAGRLAAADEDFDEPVSSLRPGDAPARQRVGAGSGVGSGAAVRGVRRPGARKLPMMDW